VRIISFCPQPRPDPRPRRGDLDTFNRSVQQRQREDGEGYGKTEDQLRIWKPKVQNSKKLKSRGLAIIIAAFLDRTAIVQNGPTLGPLPHWRSMSLFACFLFSHLPTDSSSCSCYSSSCFNWLTDQTDRLNHRPPSSRQLIYKSHIIHPFRPHDDSILLCCAMLDCAVRHLL
jgi:hypothetical protein